MGGLDDARRLSACIIGADAATQNRAQDAVLSVVVNLLKRGWPAGEALGGVLDMQKALGVGKPACREAIAILGARGLLVTRPGPGGGFFVGAPTLDDVVGATLMYLALSGAKQDCIAEFRLVIWRMAVMTAIERGLPVRAAGAEISQWGFAVDLADQLGNGAMKVAAQLAEMLARICEEPAAPARDSQIDAAILSRNVQAASRRIDALAQSSVSEGLTLGFELARQGLPPSSRTSAMALAARIGLELRDSGGSTEAEWETAERLGYTEEAVRQARRILQDLGVVRCRQGVKGAEWATPTNAAGVIRLLAPLLVGDGMSAQDNREVASALARSAPVLAARRVSVRGGDSAPAMSTDFLSVMRWENMLLELSGNPLLAIMVRSLGLANVFVDGVPTASPISPKVMDFNRRIVEAVDAGDPGAAADEALAKSRIMQESRANHFGLA